MRPHVPLVRWLLVLLLALPGLAAGGVHAFATQSRGLDPSSYESDLSGLEIEIEDDEFEIYSAEVQTYSHGQGEIVEIASNTAYVQIAFFDDTDSNAETLDIYNGAFESDVDDFEVLDEGEDRDTVYTFAVATYDDVEFYYLLAVTEDVEGNVDLLQRIFATNETFFDDVADAQEMISIGRDGFLESFDVGDLEDAAGERPARDDDEPEDEPTEEAEPEPTEETRQEPVPTIDPTGATVRDLVVVNAELVAAEDVAIGTGSAEAPGFEEVPMQYGEAEAVLLLLMRPYSPEGSLDFLLSLFTPEEGALTNIGTDADRTSAWSLDHVEEGGEEFLLYVHVQSDRYQRFHFTEILFAPVGQMTEAMSGFRDNVQVDGIPMFAEADLEAVEFLLTGGEGTDSGDDREDDRQQDDKRDIEDDEGSGEVDLESQGLVSDTEYESPQYGIGVQWDEDAWIVDTTWEQSVSSDTRSGLDLLVLFHAEENASLVVQLMPNEGEEPEAYVALWTSDEYVAGQVHEDAEVLLDDSGRSSGAVLYRSYNADGDAIMMVQEVRMIDDDVVALITVFAPENVIADAYADAEDFIEVDGDEAVGTFTPREVERALD